MDKRVERNGEITVVLAFLARYHHVSVAVPSSYRMGRRYLNVTHRSNKKDAILKRLIAS